MAISAKELPLGKVFTPDFRFTIPSFQRAYIWKTENILQLGIDMRAQAASAGHDRRVVLLFVLDPW